MRMSTIRRPAETAAQAAGPEHVSDLWRQWTAIVERLAHRRSGGARVSAWDYRLLHSALTEACRAEAANGLSPDIQRSLREIARPWITLESLTNSTPMILRSLLDQCLAMQPALPGRARIRISSNTLIAAASVLVAALILVLMAYMAPGGEAGVRSVGVAVVSLSKRLVFAVRFSSYLERFSFIAIVVVAVAILFGTHSMKRWS